MRACMLACVCVIEGVCVAISNTPANMFDVIKQEVKEVAAMIHEKENKGYFQEACSDLLEAIRMSDERGKWQMFIDALKEVCV